MGFFIETEPAEHLGKVIYNEELIPLLKECPIENRIVSYILTYSPMHKHIKWAIVVQKEGVEYSLGTKKIFFNISSCL